MSDPVTITLANEQQLQARLGAVIAGLQKPGELLDRIGGVLQKNIQFRFDTKTAPDGTKWLPLAPSTVAIYEKKYDGNIPGGLLQRTRHLRDSLTHQVGDNYVDVGFGDAIAMHHEFGTRRGLPRRQLMTDDPVAGTLSEDDRQDVLDEITAYLAEL